MAYCLKSPSYKIQDVKSCWFQYLADYFFPRNYSVIALTGADVSVMTCVP